MSEREQLQAQQEAKSGAAGTTSSAERARLWAGMNRYLAAEATHAHRVSDRESEADREADAAD